MKMIKAKKIWAKGEEKTQNSHIVVTATVPSFVGVTLRVGAGYFYKLYVGGTFVGFGPARTASGYARIDEYELGNYDGGESNEIKIEVAGYYCKSLSTCHVENFVVCELVKNGEVIAYTGKDFEIYSHPTRVQRVERYSFQRHFSEVYDKREQKSTRLQACEVSAPVTYLDRIVPYADYDEIRAECASRIGVFEFDPTLEVRKTRYSQPVDLRWGTYSEDEIEHKPFRWVQAQRQTNKASNIAFPIVLKSGEYAVIDFGRIEVGFIRWLISAKKESEVVFAFSEMRLTDRDFEFQNANMHNVVQLLLGKGETDEAESFEPYSARYLAVLVKSGEIELGGVGIKQFEHSKKGLIKRKLKDERAQEIYDSAVRTFLHNAVDIYTDCPSRERAGWLCDSFFTARVEQFLFGQSKVEQAFLQNYALYKNDGQIPQGALPMCYPADIERGGKFIPQWNMWLVLQIYEYVTERNTSADKNEYKKMLYELLELLRKYENEDGLLEKLPSWNFVEWSTANEWTNDVNYPTNFLYSKVLECVGSLFGDDVLVKKAQSVRKTTAHMAFDGQLFVDHAIRDDGGKLVNLTDASEACQYYALLFGGINIHDEKYSYLKSRVFGSFDGEEKKRNFVAVNAFIGFYLRILTLMQYGKKDLLKKDMLDFFGKMSALTGTLWEYKQHKGSYDHGFASLAAIALVWCEE